MDEEGNDQNKKTKLNPDGDNDDMSVDDPLVSCVQPQPTDEEILADLYPIIFNLEPHDSTASLISKLETTSSFQVSDLATSEENPKVIEDRLWEIYKDARERAITAEIEICGENIR